MVASAGMGAASSIFGGISKSNQYKAAAATEELNLHADNRAAGDAISRGSEDAATHSLQVSQLIGTQVAASAANGVDGSWGSAPQTVQDTRMLAEIDANRIRTNASREAEQYRISAINHQAQAGADRSMAKASLISGFMGAASSIIGGASQVAGLPSMSGGGGGGGGGGFNGFNGAAPSSSFAGLPVFRNVR